MVLPCRAFSVNRRMEKAGVLVRPTMMAPAARKLRTRGASSWAMRSRNCSTPLSVGWPFWSVLTLVVTGTPWSGPRASPRAWASSAAFAAARASSSSRRTMALTVGLMASMRVRTDLVASVAEVRPVRISRARSTASSCQSSVIGRAPCTESVIVRRAGRLVTGGGRACLIRRGGGCFLGVCISREQGTTSTWPRPQRAPRKASTAPSRGC